VKQKDRQRTNENADNGDRRQLQQTARMLVNA
jgi:hypothetical protein